MRRIYQDSRGRYLHLRRRERAHGKVDPDECAALARGWARTLLREMGISLEVAGHPTLQEPGLFVCNHVGYLDVLSFLATTECCFLAKRAISFAPIVGPGAGWLGTVWVEREKKSSRQAAREAMVRAVAEGRRVVVFPEGTTSLEGQRWRRGAFEVARDHGIPVQAAAFSSSHPHRTLWGEESFATNLWSLLGERAPIQVRLEFLAPSRIDDPTRDAERLEQEVRQRVQRAGSAQRTSTRTAG
ncbi:MAG: lysophospholipid acyltransferase family protein [Planctomycetota bacterium]